MFYQTFAIPYNTVLPISLSKRMLSIITVIAPTGNLFPTFHKPFKLSIKFLIPSSAFFQTPSAPIEV